MVVMDYYLLLNSVNGQLIRQPNSVALALARAVDPSLIGNNPIQEAQVNSNPHPCKF